MSSRAMPYRRLSLTAVIGPVLVALIPAAAVPAAAEPAAAPVTVAQSSLDDLESMLREAESRAQQLIDRQTDDAGVTRLQEELADARARLEQVSNELAASNARAQELQSQLDAVQTQAGERAGLLAEARQEIQQLSTQLQTAPDSDEVRELRDELQAANQRVEQLATARAEAEARLREEARLRAEAAEAAAGSEVTATEPDAAAAWAEEAAEALEARTQELETAEARIAELEGELDNARTSRAQAEEALGRTREDAERRIAQMETALAESTARAERMGEQYRVLQSRVEQLNAVLTQVRAERETRPAPGGDQGGAPQEAELALALAREVEPPPDRSDDGAAATTAALAAPNDGSGAAAGLRALTTRTVSAASARRYVADLGAEQRQEGLTITVPGDLFQVDSAAISDEADRLLWRVAALLAYYSDRPVQIVGHTDSLGDPLYNRTLSERRAGAIRDYFVERFGIDPGRLTTEGLGEARPVASNDTPAGRQQNRRVEVVIRN